MHDENYNTVYHRTYWKHELWGKVVDVLSLVGGGLGIGVGFALGNVIVSAGFIAIGAWLKR